jgi:hypothetical protein
LLFGLSKNHIIIHLYFIHPLLKQIVRWICGDIIKNERFNYSFVMVLGDWAIFFFSCCVS